MSRDVYFFLHIMFFNTSSLKQHIRVSEFKVFPALYFPSFGRNVKIHGQYHQKIINSNSAIKPLENCVKHVKSYQ